MGSQEAGGGGRLEYNAGSFRWSMKLVVGSIYRLVT